MMACDQSVARQVLLQKPNFKFVVPGPHSELWVDNYTILKQRRQHRSGLLVHRLPAASRPAR